MARIKDTSVEAVKQPPTWSRSSRRARRSARPARATPAAARSTRSGRRASPSTRSTSSTTASAAARAATSITFVRETESLDFAGAIEWLAERFRVDARVRGDARRRRGAARSGASGCTRCSSRRRRSTSATSGRRAAGEPVRDYLAEPRARRGGLPRVPARSLARGNALARKAQREGLHARRAARGRARRTARGGDYFPQRLLFPLADARGRVVGFQARKLHEDDPLTGKYVNSPEGELFHKSAILYGLNLARAAIAKQERAVVVEGNTDVIALRQAGFEPVVASMGTALDRAAAEGARAADAPALPLLRRRRGRRGGDAARDGARDCAAASTCGS